MSARAIPYPHGAMGGGGFVCPDFNARAQRRKGAKRRAIRAPPGRRAGPPSCGDVPPAGRRSRKGASTPFEIAGASAMARTRPPGLAGTSTRARARPAGLQTGPSRLWTGPPGSRARPRWCGSVRRDWRARSRGRGHVPQDGGRIRDGADPSAGVADGASRIAGASAMARTCAPRLRTGPPGLRARPRYCGRVPQDCGRVPQDCGRVPQDCGRVWKGADGSAIPRTRAPRWRTRFPRPRPLPPVWATSRVILWTVQGEGGSASSEATRSVRPMLCQASRAASRWRRRAAGSGARRASFLCARPIE